MGRMDLSPLRRLLAGNTFVGHAARLGSSSALAQLMVLATAPVVSRLYGPVELGLFGLFMSFFAFASVATSLRYELAIVSVQDEVEAKALVRLVMAISVPVAGIAAVGLYALGNWKLLSFDRLPSVSSAGMFVLLCVTGWLAGGRYWLVRQQRFSTVSSLTLLQGGARALIPLVYGVPAMGWLALLIAEAMGRVLGLARFIVDESLHLNTATPAIATSVWMLKRHWRYPLVVTPSSLLDALAFALPIPLISTLHGSAAAGSFWLANMVLAAPAALIVAAVSDVFHQRFAAQYHLDSNGLWTMFLTSTRWLGTIAIVLYGVIAGLSPLLFGVVFGYEWKDSGWMVSLLAPISIASLVVSPLSRVLVVINQPGIKLLVDMLMITVTIITLWSVQTLGGTLVQSIAAYSVAVTLNYAVYFFLIRRALVRTHTSEARYSSRSGWPDL